MSRRSSKSGGHSARRQSVGRHRGSAARRALLRAPYHGRDHERLTAAAERGAVTTSSQESVLLIGASRGLGLAMAEEYVQRGWQVMGTVRGSGRTGLHDLFERSKGQLEIETVDINVPDQVLTLHQRLKSRLFDLLFIDAGVTNGPQETIADVSTEEFTRLMVTNALSPMRVLEALQDLVPARGTLGVMSSGQAASPSQPTTTPTAPGSPASTQLIWHAVCQVGVRDCATPTRGPRPCDAARWRSEVRPRRRRTNGLRAGWSRRPAQLRAAAR